MMTFRSDKLQISYTPSKEKQNCTKICFQIFDRLAPSYLGVALVHLLEEFEELLEGVVEVRLHLFRRKFKVVHDDLQSLRRRKANDLGPRL
jgi:hypothetical protein